SPEKVAVLEARLAAGVALWHPADLRGSHSARDGYDVPVRPTRPPVTRSARRHKLPPAVAVRTEGVIDSRSGKKPFLAFVRVDGRRVYLGRFRTLCAAAETARRGREVLARRSTREG